MKKKTIIKNVEKDIYQIIADIKKLEIDYANKSLTTAKYEGLKYVYACKAAYLVRVIELAKQHKISFELPVIMNKLPDEFVLEEINLENIVCFVYADLSSKLNLKKAGGIQKYKPSIEAFAEKYSKLLPMEEDLSVSC